MLGVTALRSYQSSRSAPRSMPDYVVFSYDGSAGRAEPIVAPTPDDAVAQVLTDYRRQITLDHASCSASRSFLENH